MFGSDEEHFVHLIYILILLINLKILYISQDIIISYIFFSRVLNNYQVKNFDDKFGNSNKHLSQSILYLFGRKLSNFPTYVIT